MKEIKKKKKTTTRYHLIHVRTAIIRNKRSLVLWGSGEIEIGAATVKKSMEVFHKIKSRASMWSRNSTSGYLSKGKESSIGERYLCSRNHWSIIYDSQHMKATQASPDGSKDKENMNIYTNICIYIKWIYIQLWEKKKAYRLQQHEWNLRMELRYSKRKKVRQEYWEYFSKNPYCLFSLLCGINKSGTLRDGE